MATTGFTTTPPQLIGGLGEVEQGIIQRTEERMDALAEQRREIIERWSSLELLEGLENVRENIATLYEGRQEL